MDLEQWCQRNPSGNYALAFVVAWLCCAYVATVFARDWLAWAPLPAAVMTALEWRHNHRYTGNQ